MTLLAIDPGSEHSGWVELDDADLPIGFGDEANGQLLRRIRSWAAEAEADAILAIEQIQPRYGLMIGWETIDTCRWVGRFEEAASAFDVPVRLLTRLGILKHLGVATSARKGEKKPNADSGVRMALIDRYGSGAERKGGSLYRISGHMWAALSVAVAARDGLEATP